MALGGDPEQIRALARRMRSEASDVELTASHVRRGEGIHWVGTAAERYRERLRDHAREIDETRDAISTAATKLDDLADTLEERQRLIANAMNLVEDTLSNARDTVGRFAGAVWDTLTGAEKKAEEAARDLIDGIGDLPPPGHPDWLDLARRIGK